uniref:V-set domain-containing T-cell activation inhibitor 1-like n=1 Tax=Monopterus albus TaxID=43700 RepID=UPI0009B330A7|nr:V-set domain-containing T-cell activation inhibitor 1-like [Monopterus albus]
MAMFVLVLLLLCPAASGEDLQVELGQNVNLPCKTNSSHIRAVEWTKTDLEEPEYVLFYRDGHLDGADQHSSFKGRVDLLDRQMKNGDLTLSLRNVTSTDTGTYECRVSAGGSGRRKRAKIKGDLISRVKLELKQHPDQINKTAEPGENITLPCRAPSSTNITVVEWIRPDLRPEYVFVYRSMQHDPDNQHEFFKDRVELEDSEMKDGNVSLVLRNVTTGDRGTYECRVVQGKTTRRKRYLNNEPISTIYLDVKLGSTGGQTHEEESPPSSSS